MTNMVNKYLFIFVLGFNLTMSAFPVHASEVHKLAVESDILSLRQEFAIGSISSAQLAELALSKLDAVQSQLQVQLQERESLCLDHFFTNACLQDIRLKRRELQEILRAISIEAKSFLRRSRADKTNNVAEQRP